MRALRIILSITAGVVGACALILLAGHFGVVKFVKPYVVQSGSMSPFIPTGSIVLTTPSKAYQQNDVITFFLENDKKNLITHRIVFAKYPTDAKEETVYLTTGDANEELDRWEVKQQDVVGKVFLTVPYVGYGINLVKQPKGFILLVIIPATILVYEELRSVRKELGKAIAKRRKKKEEEGDFDEKRGMHKAVMVVPIVGCVLVFISLSASFFLDNEESKKNVFSAAASFDTSPTPTPNPSETPTPTPSQIANHLVINEVMFDPPNESACGAENDAEWVEIYNPVDSDINLDTWAIGDTIFTDDLPNVTLPTGGFAIISDCAQSSFTTIWPLPGGIIYIDLPGPIGNGLNNGGEYMRLLNGATLVDDMSYGSNTTAFSPSAPAPVADHSLERDPDGIDTDTASDFADRTTPSPGT